MFLLPANPSIFNPLEVTCYSVETMYSSTSQSRANHHHHHLVGVSHDNMAALPFPLLPLPQLSISDQLGGDLDSLTPLSYNYQPDSSSYSGGSSSSCYDSPSYAGCGDPATCFHMQRSISSHALQQPHAPLPHWGPEFVDSDNCSVRRVYSAGDLEMVNGGRSYKRSESPPLRSESSMIIEGMNRASKYSPEEKKERIERYKSKRNQRNFNKKIKYACRKTLADSRPRIRGRFARNDDMYEQKSWPTQQWSMQMCGEEDEVIDIEDENWINFLDAFSTGNLIP